MTARQPNVLVLLTHDVGHQYGCFGNDQVKTPNIDRLATESVAFDRHYCHWPLCGPARANLFTGCRPPTTRRYNNDPFLPGFRQRLGSQFATIPEHFRNHGYQTGAAGLVFHDVPDPASWSLGHYKPTSDELYGPERAALAEGIPRDLWHRWQMPESFAQVRERWEALKAAGYTEADLGEGHISRRARGPAVEAYEGPLGDLAYNGGHIARHTVQTLKNLPKDEPFFWVAGFIDPHFPFMSPKKYWDLYDRAELRLPPFRQPPEGTTDWAMGDCEAAQYYTRTGYEEPWLPTDEESLEMLHGRLAVLSYYDALVGQILDTLDAEGLADDTIVVFISDHGFHDGEHGYWGKHNVWDKSLLAPLMIRMPRDRRTTGRVDGLTEHADVYPTLCDLAGLPTPEGFIEGDSFATLVDSPADEFKEAVFAHRRHQWHDRIQAYDVADTVRTKRYRLTRYLDEDGNAILTELFDYDEDPHETRNWADDPAYATARKDLESLLASGWQGVRPSGSGKR